MSPGAVLAIFGRYGRPLAVEMPPPAADALTELGFAQRSRRGRSKEPSQGSCLIDQRAVLEQPEGGPATVRVLQVLGYGDVIPNDYFVLEPRDGPAVAVSAPFFASALEALARAAGLG